MRRRLTAVIAMIVICFALRATGAPAFAAGPDLNLYPVLPSLQGAVGAHVYALAARGKRLGNRMNVFSKVGDSITSSDYFLTPIGAGGLRLESFTNLQSAALYFAQPIDSFTRISFAAQGGWKSGDLLDPARVQPGRCLPNESPIDCELRANRPEVALIMIGTNDMEDGNLAGFAANLDRIVSVFEQRGVIPVVSTVPIRRDEPGIQGRNYAYNIVIVQVAQAHNVPLWNYWLALEGLPSNGVSPDLIHPSLPYDRNAAIFDGNHLLNGFNVRNLNALQILDSLMRVLRQF